MTTLIWAAVMVIFMVAIVFQKKIPVPYAMMAGPVIIALLMGYSLNEILSAFLDQLNSMMKTAGLMTIFAMLYFGMLTEQGFFRRIGGFVFGLTKGKMSIYLVMIMTVILTAIGMLTATITTTYLIVFPLMLVFYERMKFDKQAAMMIVTCTCSAMCFVPWGIGVAMTAAFVDVDVMELCRASIPISLVFIPAIVLEILYFGRCHRKAGGVMKLELTPDEMKQLVQGEEADGNHFVINLIVFLGCVACLFCGVPAYLVFMIGAMITLIVCYQKKDSSKAVIARVSPQIINVLVMLVGVSMYVGIFNSTGMVAALGEFMTGICPAFLLRYFHVILLAFCVIVVRFIPYQFYNSMLPLLVSVGGSAGLAPAFVAAAFIDNLSLGTGSSPMTAATHVGTGLLGIDVNEYANRAMKVQTVANLFVILVCVVLGIM